MSVIDENVLKARFGGIQIALFELIWPTFEWIEGVFLANRLQTYEIYVQAIEAPTNAEWSDCTRLLREIFDVALDGSHIQIQFACRGTRPADPLFKEIMSEVLFKMIAEEVAPWRLDIGR
jgi:hypothetical protein